jgi:hypothetical protein
MRRALRFLAAGVTALFAAPVVLAVSENPPTVVAVALDTSGSIRPDDLEKTRDLALALQKALPPGSEMAVLTFDDQSRVVAERTAQADPVREAIMSAQASGRFTALHDALYDASRYLRDAPGARKAIVLLTDGRDENSALNLDDGLAVATSSGIPVFAIGLGRAEEKTLRRIAKLTGGEYVPVDEARADVLASQIASLATPTPAAVATPAAPAVAAPSAVPATVETAAPAPRWRQALWLLFVVAVLVAGVLLLVALARRTAPASTSIQAPAEPATFISDPGAASGNGSEPGPAAEEESDDPSYSPTMVGPMPTSEEYLDKTITLSELPTLVVQGGPQSGQFHVLMQNTTTCLGRARANDMVIDDVSASGQHCRIRFESGRFVVHDLKSTNGTFVNEQRVTRHVLKPGDVLKLGETYVQFKLDRRKA